MFSGNLSFVVFAAYCVILFAASLHQFVKSDDSEYRPSLDSQYHGAKMDSKTSENENFLNSGQSQSNRKAPSTPLVRPQDQQNVDDATKSLSGLDKQSYKVKSESKTSGNVESREYGQQQSYKNPLSLVLEEHQESSLADSVENDVPNQVTLEHQDIRKVENSPIKHTATTQTGLLVQNDPQCLCEGDGFVPWSEYDYSFRHFSYNYCKNGSRYEASIHPYTMGCLYIPYPTQNIALLANHDRCIGENLKFRQRTHGVSIGWDQSKSRNVLFEFCGQANEPTCCKHLVGSGNHRTLMKGYCMVYLLDSDYFQTTLSDILVKLSKKQSRQYLSANVSADQLLKVFLDILKGEANSTSSTSKNGKNLKKYKPQYGDHASSSSNKNMNYFAQDSYQEQHKDGRSNSMISDKKKSAAFTMKYIPETKSVQTSTAKVSATRESLTTFKTTETAMETAKSTTLSLPTAETAEGTVNTESRTTTLSTSSKVKPSTTLTSSPAGVIGQTKIKIGQELEVDNHINVDDSCDNEIVKKTTLCIFNDILCAILDWF